MTKDYCLCCNLGIGYSREIFPTIRNHSHYFLSKCTQTNKTLLLKCYYISKGYTIGDYCRYRGACIVPQTEVLSRNLANSGRLRIMSCFNWFKLLQTQITDRFSCVLISCIKSSTCSAGRLLKLAIVSTK